MDGKVNLDICESKVEVEENFEIFESEEGVETKFGIR